MEKEQEQATEQFRKILLIGSLFFGIITALIVISEPTGCPNHP
jgi:hypothetical protein